MDNSLLSKIITGKALPEEKEQFYSLLKKDKKLEAEFFEAQSLWVKSGAKNPQKNIDVDAEFKQFWHKANASSKQKKVQIFRIIIRYAAIVIITLGIGIVGSYQIILKPGFEIAQNDGVHKYSALKGSIAKVELEDGTLIWLNSNSELTYHENKDDNTRNAILKGEAYFKIMHMEDKPFVIDMGKIKVRDLGTAFNIKAYPEDKFIETTLVEGDAEILDSKDNALTALTPGTSAFYDIENNHIVLAEVNPSLLTAWKDGKFVFRDKPLEEICSELQKWYDIDFEFRNPKIKEYKYTGSIKRSTSAKYVMKMLKVTTNINYEIIEKEIENDVIIIY